MLKTYRIYYEHEDQMFSSIIKALDKKSAKLEFESTHPSCYIKLIEKI